MARSQVTQFTGHEVICFFARTFIASISMRQPHFPIYEQSKTFTLCNRAYETHASTYSLRNSCWLKQRAAGRLMRWAFRPLGCSTRNIDCRCPKQAPSVSWEYVKHIHSRYTSHCNPLHLSMHAYLISSNAANCNSLTIATSFHDFNKCR